MKKLAVMFAIGALIGLAETARAQTLTVGFPIRVAVASDPINLFGVTNQVSFGTVGFSQTNLSNFGQGQPRSTVQNNGYATIDYTAKASITQGLWTLGAAPGNNVASLYAIFTQALTAADDPVGGRNIAFADFAAEDRLSSVAIRASSTILARNGETGTEVNGNNVFTTNPIRSLRYMLLTPTGGDTSVQVVLVTVGAIAL